MRTFQASLLAASALTTLMAAPAFAQGATEAAQQDVAQSTADDEEEIIVTARRREESLSDVPVSITALSAEALEDRGIERVDDLTRSVPSLKMNATAGRRSNSQYELRGINVVESLVTQDPPVGIYINEVFRARATGTNQSFFDIENVQVLYGPQGTLFGRSASAGAVLITTRRPTNVTEGMISVGYGNFDRFELSGMLNVPVSERFALRFAAQHTRSDGFSRNLTSGNRLGGTNNYGARVSALFTPVDGFENYTVLSAYAADERGSAIFLRNFRPCPPAGVTPRPAASCGSQGANLANFFAQQQALGPYQVQLDATLNDWAGLDRRLLPTQAGRSTDPYERAQNYSLTNTTTIDVSDQITFKNIFGYNGSHFLALADLDATPIKFLDVWYDQDATQLSNEVQLQGDMGRLDWVVGGIWFQEKGRDIQNSIQNIVAYSHQNLVAINTSYALFAQATYEVLPGLSVTAGGRYSWDNRVARYQRPFTQVGTAAQFCTLTAAVDPDGDCFVRLETTIAEPTYTLTIDYKPREDVLFYASTRRGYRSGGFQSRVVNVGVGLEPFEPETVQDVEVGFRGEFRLGDGDFLIRPSISLYKSWWDNLQRSTTVLTGVTTPPTSTLVVNAASATIQGFEASIGIRPFRGLNIDAYLGYVDGRYNEFVSGATTLTDIRFPTSKWTGGVNVNATLLDRPEVGSISASAAFYFRSHFFADQSLPIIEPESRVPATQNLNLSLEWENIAGSNFSAQLWARNVTDEVIIAGQTTLAGSFGIVPAVLAEPRTYGLTLRFNFGR